MIKFKKFLLILFIILPIVTSDQVSKFYIMEYFSSNVERQIPITYFFDLVLVYNKGVSFGLLNHLGSFVFWSITGLSGLIILGLCVWILTEKNFWNMVGLASILGGAIGNLIDRIRLEAVVDFLYFHLGPYYWPAFNIADSAIVMGVGLLLWQHFWDAFRKKDKRTS